MSTTATAPPPAAAPAAAPQGSTLTELVSGILGDAQRLLKQQVDMVRAEFKDDLRKTKQAGQYLGVGAGIAAVGLIHLTVALVYLLHELAPSLPLSACWAIVGGVAVVAGLGAMYCGSRIIAKNNPLPDKSFTALQENVSWAAKPQS
jgi:hypothetical protein